MKKIILLIVLTVILCLIALISYSIYSKNTDEKITLVSPVPDFLNSTKNKEVSTLSLWIPVLANFIQNKSNEPQ
nr:hypothetical protein [Candidatus Levybacteria bacterium]